MKTDHSISKGYPFDKVMSQERFKNRPVIVLNTENYKVESQWDKETFPTYKKPNFLQRLLAGSIINFLTFRLFDYAEALIVAENQIKHILQDEPFIPEEFGFVKMLGPKDIKDRPEKIYVSKYNEDITLFRSPDKNHEWHLLERKADDAFKDTVLNLPNHRIAYAAFVALSIKVEENDPLAV
jgi:hypothetical protein